MQKTTLDVQGVKIDIEVAEGYRMPPRQGIKAPGMENRGVEIQDADGNRVAMLRIQWAAEKG